jgi:hypothetical protein
MRAENKADPFDPFSEQLELSDPYDDGLSWGVWFRALPLIPPDAPSLEADLRARAGDVQLTLGETA